MRGSGKLRRDSHPADLAHRAQEPSTLACDLPRFANSRRAGHRLGDQSVWRLQRCGCTDRFVPVASDQYPCRDHGCFGATVPSRATLAAVLRSERPAKPEADATAVERLFALADQTENSPSRKAVEARPSYCQAENNTNGRPKGCGGAPHKTGNPVEPLTARSTSRTRPVICNPTRGYEC